MQTNIRLIGDIRRILVKLEKRLSKCSSIPAGGSAILRELDEAVYNVLEADPTSQYTTSKLADIVTHTATVSVGSGMLRKRYLKAVRENPQYKSAKYYNLDTAKWRFKAW